MGEVEHELVTAGVERLEAPTDVAEADPLGLRDALVETGPVVADAQGELSAFGPRQDLDPDAVPPQWRAFRERVAKADGVVTKGRLEVGQVIQPGQALLAVTTLEKLLIVQRCPINRFHFRARYQSFSSSKNDDAEFVLKELKTSNSS